MTRIIIILLKFNKIILIIIVNCHNVVGPDKINLIYLKIVIIRINIHKINIKFNHKIKEKFIMKINNKLPIKYIHMILNIIHIKYNILQ